MRTKRLQRRRANAARAVKRARLGLPDPFSRCNTDLVEDEIQDQLAFELECPCCRDREFYYQDLAYERWLLGTR
jgi:hypothetical protein